MAFCEQFITDYACCLSSAATYVNNTITVKGGDNLIEKMTERKYYHVGNGTGLSIIG